MDEPEEVYASLDFYICLLYFFICLLYFSFVFVIFACHRGVMLGSRGPQITSGDLGSDFWTSQDISGAKTKSASP